ncbi:extracellular calcium-sensing receptor-like [Pseudophryne corroboree]|uniref:extracellular calcium-sensing receptor-like n=1 Tax=Pseudophryne corroboree TaxID=495146 RepID=UPI00308219B1
MVPPVYWSFRSELYKSALALLFAVQEINEDPYLLPNITLGFQMYDSCYSEPPALQATFQLTSGGNYAPNYNCAARPLPPAVIGDISTSSLAIGRVLGLWRLPQISYIASVPALSNKLDFPSFLRTSVSVANQPQAVIEMCLKFGWTWIGIFISSIDYYLQAGTTLKREATRNGICIAFFETVDYVLSIAVLPTIIETVRRSKATVVILYCSHAEASMIFIGVLQHKLFGKVWIGTEAWFTTPIFKQKQYWDLLNGTIGIARSRNTLPHFSSFLQSVHPSTYSRMLSIQQFWEILFNCRWAVGETNSSVSSAVGPGSRVCTGLEKLVTDDITEYNDPTSQAVYSAHNALYAIAHALHNLLICEPDEGPFAGKSCADKHDIKPWQVNVATVFPCPTSYQHITSATHPRHGLQHWMSMETCFHGNIHDGFPGRLLYECPPAVIRVLLLLCMCKVEQLLYHLRRVHFVNTAGEEVSFDANGDINGYFDILNWQLEDNIGKYVKVGTVSPSQGFSSNNSAIYWAGGPGKVPKSVCSSDCPPGYRKTPRRGQPVCCFDCLLCPEGMISNQTNSMSCFICPEDQWSNNERTKCVPKVIEFLSYEEPLGLVMASFSVIFSLATMMVLCVFLRFRDTVVVKANNRNLSYLLLLSLTFCFLCSLAFIGRPSRLTCTIRQALFGVIFSLCISCILAKTIIVVIAFNATRPGSNLRAWVGFQTALLVVFTSNCVQVIIILVWLVRFPPFLEPNYHVLTGVILMECNEGSVIMFYCTIGYLGFLASISFVVAFLARNLPDSFNEAKYITFSMLTFLSVWASFIPTYLSTKGKYVVASEIFAILLSSFGLLCFIFGPKCNVILLKPSMNTREYLRSNA